MKVFIGFVNRKLRILERSNMYESTHVVDMTKNEVLHKLRSGTVIDGIRYDSINNKIVYNSGNMNRYPSISEEDEKNKKSLIMIARIIKNKNLIGYRFCNIRGEICTLSIDEAIKAAKTIGVANARINTRNNKEYLSKIGSGKLLDINIDDNQRERTKVRDNISITVIDGEKRDVSIGHVCKVVSIMATGICELNIKEAFGINEIHLEYTGDTSEIRINIEDNSDTIPIMIKIKGKECVFNDGIEDGVYYINVSTSEITSKSRSITGYIYRRKDKNEAYYGVKRIIDHNNNIIYSGHIGGCSRSIMFID